MLRELVVNVMTRAWKGSHLRLIDFVYHSTLESTVESFGFRVRVDDSGLRIEGLGFRAEGLRFRV